MKLNALFIFLIILASLLLCNCLGKSLYEGLDSENTNSVQQNDTTNINNNEFDTGKNISYGSLLDTNTDDTIENINHTTNSLIPEGNSSIPEGDEDLYMLKSQMVPPVCPACPEVKACPRKEKCPPCPPCARCPEPSFECKKVPNYSSKHNDSLPRPVLADFSQFGM